MGTDPIGPAGWTLQNWFGFCVQIAGFLFALWILYRVSRAADHPPEASAAATSGSSESPALPGKG